MTDRYKESIQGARDCVERNKDGGVYLPDLVVVIDSQQAEIERLNVELVGMRGACNSYKMHYENAKAEIERLQNESIGNCELAISMRNDNNLKGDCSYCIDKAKAEAEQKLKEMRCE